MSHESNAERDRERERERRAQATELFVKDLLSELNWMRETSDLEPDEFDKTLADYVARREEKAREGKQ